ncbi:hypothetical protein TIFTF001_003525 [Ficus carica]|uniref:Uncharacterized protein n=1 Tax=Ficus carica TaxID=3494 RepID=A0AA88CUD2_FICCA|nr:hypothetical protein TIFTF001_003525 [Ficus carica]
MEKVGGGSRSHVPRHSNMAAHTLAKLAWSGLIIEIVFGWMLVPLFFMILCRFSIGSGSDLIKKLSLKRY